MTGIQPLDPIALRLGPIEIHWYGVIIGLGIALGLYLAIREGEKRHLPKDAIADLMIWAIPFAIIGARIYYVLFQWEYYAQNPGDIIKIWNGGLAIHGALIGAVLTTIIFTQTKKISFWKMADIVAPSLVLGQAIGRWGNFINQEAHGGEVSRAFLEGLFLPEFIVNQMYIDGIYYHPTFLYESLWNIGVFILLIALRRVNLRRGEIFLSYLITYSIGRFFIEGLRTDSLMLSDSLRIAQVISLGIILAASAVWIYRRKSKLANKHYLED